MVDQEVVEQEVRTATKQLMIGGRYRQRVRKELVDHVVESATARVESGMSEDEAIRAAVGSLGLPSDIANRYQPQPGRWARRSGVAFAFGVITLFASNWAANALHERGQRLGDLPYTLVWIVGWIGLLCVAAPMLSLLARYAVRMSWATAAVGGALVAIMTLGVLFFLRSDGAIETGPTTSVWRLAAVTAGAVASCGVLAIARRRGGADLRPVAVAVLAVTLLVAHYILTPSEGPLALIALGLLVVSGAWIAFDRIREHSLT